MAKVTVHAGDFPAGAGDFEPGRLYLPNPSKPGGLEIVPAAELEAVDLATEETVKSIGGSLGWGAAGAIAFGPVGLLAGVLLGSKSKKQVTFACRLKDGRRFLATTDNDTFVKLKAATF